MLPTGEILASECKRGPPESSTKKQLFGQIFWRNFLESDYKEAKFVSVEFVVFSTSSFKK
jgi:hypothetical protein